MNLILKFHECNINSRVEQRKFSYAIYSVGVRITCGGAWTGPLKKMESFPHLGIFLLHIALANTQKKFFCIKNLKMTHAFAVHHCGSEYKD